MKRGVQTTHNSQPIASDFLFSLCFLNVCDGDHSMLNSRFLWSTWTGTCTTCPEDAASRLEEGLYLGPANGEEYICIVSINKVVSWSKHPKYVIQRVQWNVDQRCFLVTYPTKRWYGAKCSVQANSCSGSLRVRSLTSSKECGTVAD